MVVCVKSYCSPKSSCIPPLVRPVTLSAHPVWVSIPNKSSVCSSIKTHTLFLNKKIIASCSKSPKDDLDLDLDNIILDLERACQLVVEQVDPSPQDLFHTMSINYSFTIDSCPGINFVKEKRTLINNVDDRAEGIKNLSEDLEALNSPNASRAAHLIKTISTKILDAESSCHVNWRDYYRLQFLTSYKKLGLLNESLRDFELPVAEWPKKLGPRMTLNDLIREWPIGGDEPNHSGLQECDSFLSDLDNIYVANLKNQIMLQFSIIPLFETCVASLIKYLVR